MPRLFTALLLTSALAIAILSSAPVAAQAFAEPESLDALVQAVVMEGSQLEIAWSSDMYGGGPGLTQLEQTLAAAHGIHLTVKFTPLGIPGGAFESQIAQEVKAGHAASSDILFNVYGPPVAEHMQAVDWRRYVPELPAELVFFDRRAVGMVSMLSGFTYNSKLVPPDRVPHSLADMLTPFWKGKIATSPYQGIYGAFLGLPEVLGEEGMRKFYGDFSKQLGGLIRCGSQDRILSGEFLLYGFDCGDYAVRQAQRAGMPLATIYPREGVGLSMLAPGIPKTAPHPYAARLMIATMLSRAGQDVLWNAQGTDNAMIPGSNMKRIIDEQRANGIKIVEVFGLAVTHPQLTEYVHTIDRLVTQAK